MASIITEYDTIIVGAGPAGLQLGYFLQKQNIKYLIIEKTTMSASFFNKYPHSKQLISLNKAFTGKDDADFNLRHDWNSLLNDESLLFKQYSEELYPSSNDLHAYLNDFANNNKLNIQYNTTIKQINKLNENNLNSNKLNKANYELVVSDEVVYHCSKLIMATGLSKQNLPDIKFVHSNGSDTGTNKIKHYGDFPSGYFKDKAILSTYKSKKVLLIGGGNASYELGNILQSYCSNIIIMGSTKDLSIVSHYTGDIRSIYLPFLDTFYLKSMNGIDKINKEEQLSIIQNKEVGNVAFNKYKLTGNGVNAVYNDTQDLEYYDEIIYCTGWKFDGSIFNFELKTVMNNKFPEINAKYESVDNPNLFFIGSLMHSRDFKKSSGGFIHGFRYLIKLFTQTNFNMPFKIHKFKFDGTLNCYVHLADHMFKRINFASSIYQMYGVLKDIYYFNKDTEEIIYYEDITMDVFFSIMNKLDNTSNSNDIKYIHCLHLVYGEKIYDVKQLGGFNKYNPVFLHPEILVVEKNLSINIVDKITFEEDLVADFKSAKFYDKIKRSLKFCNLIV
jgi:thioredoxin reductase